MAMHMTIEELRQFYSENPLLYGDAPPEDTAQLSRIYEFYPDSVRLLTDREAVRLAGFECRRCGACCASIKYITVCFSDVKRWVEQRRWDILEELDIDRTVTPLLANCGKKVLMSAKKEAEAVLEGLDVPDRVRVRELLFITGSLESAVYVSRKNNACAFLINDGLATCTLHDTKPRVCGKFPYYIGHFTDGRLIKEDSFCPTLREIAKKDKK
jgi:Fe-S-cluster containining protein